MFALVASILLSTTSSQAGITGTWKGESVCMVRPSACHDETVIYDITEAQGKLQWKASKIVDGEEQWMGTLECDYQPSKQLAVCEIPKGGQWRLHAEGDSMTGTLNLPDGTLYRKVTVKRYQRK